MTAKTRLVAQRAGEFEVETPSARRRTEGDGRRRKVGEIVDQQDAVHRRFLDRRSVEVSVIDVRQRNSDRERRAGVAHGVQAHAQAGRVHARWIRAVTSFEFGRGYAASKTLHGEQGTR